MSHLYYATRQIVTMADAYYVADNCHRLCPGPETVRKVLDKLTTSRAVYRDYAITKLENYAFLEGIQL